MSADSNPVKRSPQLAAHPLSATARLGQTWLIILLTGLAAGCDRTPPPEATPAIQQPSQQPATQAPETFEQREARLDATVWRDETAALQHEAAFVGLRDALRRATNKVAVLAPFDLDEISLPAPRSDTRLLGLGIREYPFDDTRREWLPRRVWAETLARLHGLGWRIAQGERTHHRFAPARSGHAATSELSFHLYGTRPPAVRFIVEGTLAVEWDAITTNAPVRVHRLVVSNLTVLERHGLPGFARTAVVTPNPPERLGDMINLHPLVVTDINGDGNEDVILVAGSRRRR
jgi:hypothetical protein